MLCQYSRTAQPRASIVTLTTLPLLFASSAWAAPLSSLEKRGSSSGSKIMVRSVPLSFFSSRSRSPFLPRHLSSSSLSSSSQSPYCSTGSKCFLSSGTSLFTLCWHRTTRPPLLKFGTSPRRRSQGQPQPLRLRPRQLLAQSDGRGVIGVLLVKSRLVHCQHT